MCKKRFSQRQIKKIFKERYVSLDLSEKIAQNVIKLPKNVIKKSRVNNMYFLFELKVGVKRKFFLDLKTYYSVRIGMLHSISLFIKLIIFDPQ